MELIKKLIELVYYYKKDSISGLPYWQDPTLIGAALGVVCTELAKVYGLHVDADLQLKIVGVITGVGALLSPHTGIKQKPVSSAPKPEEHNLSSLS